MYIYILYRICMYYNSAHLYTTHCVISRNIPWVDNVHSLITRAYYVHISYVI